MILSSVFLWNYFIFIGNYTTMRLKIDIDLNTNCKDKFNKIKNYKRA